MTRMTLSLPQAQSMLELQNKMNLTVNPDWLQAGYPFLRAVVVEGGEAIEHHGWKWWKAQTPDMDQLKLELVDIWHFILSDFIVKARGNLSFAASAVANASRSHPGVAGSVVFDGVNYRLADLDLLGKCEMIIGLAVARRVSVPLFESVMADCGLAWSDLYRQYVSKNVLNIFRQEHGYKEGHYIKHWGDGREDNQHLVEVMDGLDADAPDFMACLYADLKSRYDQIRPVAAAEQG